ncbi:MAG TPA: hypothetical protein VIC33_02095, partial [Vicinamibacterales bacterium]
FYRMPFQIGITTAASPAGERRAVRPSPPPPPPVIMLTGAHTTLRIPLADAPESVVLDPNHWVTMAEVTFSRR